MENGVDSVDLMHKTFSTTELVNDGSVWVCVQIVCVGSVKSEMSAANVKETYKHFSIKFIDVVQLVSLVR